MTPRLALVVLAAAIGAPGAHAQSPAASPPPRAAVKPSPPAPPVFEGTVTGPDGKPVAGAVVVASAVAGSPFDPPVVARTGEDGAFRLAARRRAPHALHVEAAGLAAHRIERATPGEAVRVRLARGGAIDGVVRDADTREPVAGARVEARGERGAPLVPGEPAIGVVAARTDASGVFRLEGLAPGRHSLVASSRSAGRATRSGVAVGQRVELLLVAGAALTGRVRSADGKPVAGAAVRLDPESGPGHNRTVATDADGSFEIAGVAPGAYRVAVQHRDWALGLAGGLRPQRGADAEVEITLAPPVRVTGRLVDDRDRPVAGAVALAEVDGVTLPVNPAMVVRSEAGEDGRFALGSLPPGAHVLAVTGRGVAPRRLTVDIGARQKEVDLGDVLLESGAQLRGRVRSAAGPIADAMVWAYPVGGRTPDTQPLDGRTAADGTFALGGAATAAYEVAAEAPGFAFATRRVEAPAENVDLVLEAAGSITGVVVDAAGRPVESFDATAMPTGSREMPMRRMPRSTRASSDGRFTIDDVGPGTYALRVAARELGRQVVSDVAVRGGAVTDVGRVRLAPAGVIRGSVVDASSAPVAGAVVEARTSDRMMFSADRAETATDAAGRFELAGLAPGRVVVIARHPEFADGLSAPVEVDPARPAETSVTLSRGGRIEGIVRARGTALPDRSWVMVRRMGGPETVGLPPAAFPGPDGRFALDHVTPGRVGVSLMVDTGSGRGSGLFKEAEVREGETTAVELVWREILLRGRVTRGGGPLPNVRLTAMGQNANVMFGGPMGPPAAAGPGPQRMTAVTREDGSYEMLLLDSGKILMRADAPGRSYPARPIDVPDADAHTADIDFPATGITGVVVDEATEAPIAGAYLFAMPTKPGTRGAGQARTGGDGHFTIDAEPGPFRLRASAEGYATDSVEVSVSDGAAAEVRVTLSRGGRVRGRVVDDRGRPMSGVPVVAQVEGGTEGGAGGFAQSAFDGTFEIGSLRPGSYALMAGSSLNGYGSASGVAMGADDVVLRLSPGGKVRVTVTGPDRAPVEGAFVRVKSVNGVPFSVPAMGGGRTAADGTMEVDAPAGAVEVEAGKDALRGVATVTVAAGGVAAAAVTLSGDPPPPAP